MSDEGSCVTLIFYRINPKWWKEPALNLASAVCQMSNLTHCEISIGEGAGDEWHHHEARRARVQRLGGQNIVSGPA